MAFARLSFMRNRHVRFWKLLGSGTGEGFTPIPNTSVYAILCVWPSSEIAHQQLGTARIFAKYRARSLENWTVFLTPTSVRGEWSHQTPFEASQPASSGPLAALTRATIKPSILFNFWKRVPEISDVIGDDPNVAFKIGVGEIPWLHQVTFSIWPETAAMAKFARNSGPHARAIEAARSNKWFREELYVRFAILDQQGSWGGKNPLAHLNLEPAT
jgi:spheroidene monooxygenase